VVKLPKIESWEKKIAWTVSISLGILIVVVAFFTHFGSKIFDEFVLLAVAVAVFPPSVLDYIDYRWRKSIDQHLPDLFRTIVQAQQTGMTLSQALEEASKRDYGPLTKELRKMVAQISWGMPFEEALQSFGKRVNTLLVQRTVPLIIEASRSGGSVEKVFKPLGGFVQSTLLMEKERKTQTRPYIAIIYVAFYVFLFTIVLLFKTFFVDIEGMPVLGSAIMGAEETKRVFFHMGAFQAFFGGLVAGKMGEGTLSAGLKHSLVMMLSVYLVFKFAL
jgi:flagellar protein FlaJ